MKAPFPLRLAAFALCVLHPSSSLHAQGPLTPPGVPAPTMKTLTQIEPRTPVAGGTSSITISQGGAYYLTGNITVASGDGIVIAADGVTLDLNGFIVASSASPADGTGVRISAGLRNIAIRNGTISGTVSGVGFASGVRFLSSGPFQYGPRNVRVADVSVSDCTAAGILFNPADNCHVERCLVDGSGGISATIVKDCSVTSVGAGGISGRVVENCHASTGSGTAISGQCVVNSYGLSTGDADVISAGVAHNVWASADGNAGAGAGLTATVAGNSYGSHLGGTGDGVKATVVQAGVGRSTTAAGVKASVAVASRGESSSGQGIHGDSGIVALSSGAAATGILANSGAILGSRGDGPTGIASTNGLISACFGKGSLGSGISAADGHVVGSFGFRFGPDGSLVGINAASVADSRGIGVLDDNSVGDGIRAAQFAVGSYGFFPVIAPIQFDSH